MVDEYGNPRRTTEMIKLGLPLALPSTMHTKIRDTSTNQKHQQPWRDEIMTQEKLDTKPSRVADRKRDRDQPPTKVDLFTSKYKIHWYIHDTEHVAQPQTLTTD